MANNIDSNTEEYKTTVMIVEDDSDVSYLEEVSLLNNGFNVVAFNNPIGALDYLEDNHVDIIISDVMMPQMNGYDFCAKVKNSKDKDAYFIIVTVKNEMADKVTGLALGADDYIVKPFNVMEFIARVKVGERIIRTQRQLTSTNNELERLVDIDFLTGLYNRRFFNLQISKEDHRTDRYSRSYGIMILDIDHFKLINDTYGHLTGDEILKQFAHRIKENIRTSDIGCRYGGEEFAIIIPEVKPMQAYEMGEKIRHKIASIPFKGNGDDIEITTSIGIAIKSYENKVNAEELINKADKALYQAKSTGRNRTVMALLESNSFYSND